MLKCIIQHVFCGNAKIKIYTQFLRLRFEKLGGILNGFRVVGMRICDNVGCANNVGETQICHSSE